MFLFNILENLVILVKNNFGGVIEVDTSGAIRKQIAKTIFCRIVNPFLHVDFGMSHIGVLLCCLFFAYGFFVGEVSIAVNI